MVTTTDATLTTSRYRPTFRGPAIGGGVRLLPATVCQPFFPGHEFHPDTIIVDHQVSLAITPNCVGFDFLHFLRHDPHINGSITALVAEAIELETVVEPRQRNDVLFEAEVGATATAAAYLSSTAAAGPKM